ncbi:MAG: hypothetical protein JWN84_603, partial [Nocardioides sp.]|nr:hypothetical protein [Nocardioides sp.]
MIESKPSSIGEAPSLADITSAGGRVGKVDFTTRLGDRMTDPEPESEGAAPRAAVLSLASMARPQRTAEEGSDATSMPFILPPAKVSAAMAAEAEAARLEVAAARGELPDDEPEGDLQAVEDEQDEDEPAEDAHVDEVDAVDEDEPVAEVEPEVEVEPVVVTAPSTTPVPAPPPVTVEVIAVARVADVAKATEAARAAQAAAAAEVA